MKPDQQLDLQALMANPTVKNAISNINPGLVERRAFRPPRCTVFQSAFTSLHDVHQYRFDIDPEARRQLPRIIENRVQTIVGEDQLDDGQLARFTRPRTIGIVFSGGPAPGGGRGGRDPLPLHAGGVRRVRPSRLVLLSRRRAQDRFGDPAAGRHRLPAGGAACGGGRGGADARRAVFSSRRRHT